MELFAEGGEGVWVVGELDGGLEVLAWGVGDELGEVEGVEEGGGDAAGEGLALSCEEWESGPEGVAGGGVGVVGEGVEEEVGEQGKLRLV